MWTSTSDARRKPQPLSHLSCLYITTMSFHETATYLNFHSETPSAMSFSPTSKWLALSSLDSIIFVFGVSRIGTVLSVALPQRHTASALLWETDNYLWAGLTSGQVVCFYVDGTSRGVRMHDLLTRVAPLTYTRCRYTTGSRMSSKASSGAWTFSLADRGLSQLVTTTVSRSGLKNAVCAFSPCSLRNTHSLTDRIFWPSSMESSPDLCELRRR